MNSINSDCLNDKNYVVAIDGPCATGKSTLAKQIAKRLNITYIDTGAMYRAVGLYYITNNIELNQENINKYINDINIDITYDRNQNMHVFLNNVDVSDNIRTSQVSKYASEVSKFLEVREKLVKIQQDMSQSKSVVLEGRDIATVVFPNADVKLYLTASYDVRAKRRQLDLKAKNEILDIDVIKEQLKQRDYNDMNRKYSPLRKAEDAIVLDTSELTKEQEIDSAIKIINQKIKSIGK